MTDLMNGLLAAAGMASVTYLPRLLPFVLADKLRVDGRLRRFLDQLPYAVLAALTFPAILDSTGDLRTGAAGAAAALLLSLLRLPIIAVVLGGIAAAALAGWLL
ncbi:AzlD domain-containing protein [Gorillibacterium sp. sgz500922]|uniref:AzlD domain-containing protein n=1 Tax=Gorillibacterium sp. sgz500922 TaxID=3446694 RepID=UPI003F679C66